LVAYKRQNLGCACIIEEINSSEITSTNVSEMSHVMSHYLSIVHSFVGSVIIIIIIIWKVSE